jgi:hypothetical protein
LVLIFTFPAIGERRRICCWDDADKGVNEALLMIGNGGFPNLVEPMILVDFTGAVDEFYSPSVVCTSMKVDLVKVYFDLFLVKDKLE